VLVSFSTLESSEVISNLRILSAWTNNFVRKVLNKGLWLLILRSPSWVRSLNLLSSRNGGFVVLELRLFRLDLQLCERLRRHGLRPQVDSIYVATCQKSFPMKMKFGGYHGPHFRRTRCESPQGILGIATESLPHASSLVVTGRTLVKLQSAAASRHQNGEYKLIFSQHFSRRQSVPKTST
jgi:hypothetical protein